MYQHIMAMRQSMNKDFGYVQELVASFSRVSHHTIRLTDIGHNVPARSRLNLRSPPSVHTVPYRRVVWTLRLESVPELLV